MGIAVNGDGSIIYVSDTGNHVIRRIDAEDGIVTTVAGIQEDFEEFGKARYPLGGFRNGEADFARFNSPRGIVIAGDVLIIADSGNHRIRALLPSETVITIAGNGIPGDDDGFAFGAAINGAADICYHNGRLYIADTGNNKIKIISLKL
jgi:DNA-binding beta-propeller fold protein YncE